MTNLTEEQFGALFDYITSIVNMFSERDAKNPDLLKVDADTFIKARDKMRKEFGLPPIVVETQQPDLTNKKD